MEKKGKAGPFENDRTKQKGSFDIIGDVHGCFDELVSLMGRLGHHVETIDYDLIRFGYKVTSVHDRLLVFVGDLVDRGPASPAVLKLVMGMVNNGQALCVPGNHDWQYYKLLCGMDIPLAYGLDKTVEQMQSETRHFKGLVKAFFEGLPGHLMLDDGKLMVVHAGLRQEFHGIHTAEVKHKCMYGETTGEVDEYGLSVRYDWAANYKGRVFVVYGHTSVAEPRLLSNSIDIDTGCVYGGKLTAYRYPEGEIVSVPALKAWGRPVRAIGR